MKTITRRTTSPPVQACWRPASAPRGRHSRWKPSARASRPTSGAMPTYYLLNRASWRSAASSSRSSPCRRATSPCSRWWRGKWTWPPMRQSFIIGHDKGGLVAVAQIEYVGKTAQIVTRKDLNLTKVEQLKGLKVANQTGSPSAIFSSISSRQRPASEGRLPGGADGRQQHGRRHGRQDVDAMVNVSHTTRSRWPRASAPRSWTIRASTACRCS